MGDEISDEALTDLVESGREQVRKDPELSDRAREQMSLDLGQLVERIAFELGLDID